jgi:hypothetical protein
MDFKRILNQDEQEILRFGFKMGAIFGVAVNSMFFLGWKIAKEGKIEKS